MEAAASALYSVRVFVPVTHGDAVRAALAAAGAGKFGNYDSCSFSWRGVGRFRPLKGAHPFLGTIGTIESVEEECIDTECFGHTLAPVLRAVKAAHPYEAPAIHVSEILAIDWAALLE